MIARAGGTPEAPITVTMRRFRAHYGRLLEWIVGALMVILLFGLGMGVAALEYFSMARDRMRRVEIRVRRRAARRSAA